VTRAQTILGGYFKIEHFEEGHAARDNLLKEIIETKNVVRNVPVEEQSPGEKLLQLKFEHVFGRSAATNQAVKTYASLIEKIPNNEFLFPERQAEIKSTVDKLFAAQPKPTAENEKIHHSLHAELSSSSNAYRFSQGLHHLGGKVFREQHLPALERAEEILLNLDHRYVGTQVGRAGHLLTAGEEHMAAKRAAPVETKSAPPMERSAPAQEHPGLFGRARRSLAGVWGIALPVAVGTFTYANTLLVTMSPAKAYKVFSGTVEDGQNFLAGVEDPAGPKSALGNIIRVTSHAFDKAPPPSAPDTGPHAPLASGDLPHPHAQPHPHPKGLTEE
ncbi:MAG TPA: hypothetical protein VHB73_02490, partial [Alphaproteobacteria bacterium]|nr:hypothetical protein [Alphaproteobacteria bacterium]